MNGTRGTAPTASCRATLSADDWRRYVAAARRHLLPNTGAARVAYGAAGVAVGVSIGLLPSAGPVGFVLLALTAVAIVVAVVFNVRFSTAMRVGLAGPLVMLADADGVTVAQGPRSTHFGWSAVVGWSEDGDRYFVTIAPFVGWPLPKTGFARTADVAWFRAQLAAVRQPTGN